MKYSPKLKKAMAQVPENIQRLWDNQGFEGSIVVIQPISETQGASMGSTKLQDKGFGNRTVIGAALTIKDADSKGEVVTVSNGALLTY